MTALKRPLTSIAFQGEQGSFSEIAAKKFFRSSAHFSSLHSFRDVFEHVARKKVQFGVVPIENSVFGSIHQNYDLLFDHKLFIVGEITLRIKLHLAALPGVALNEIRSIYSQPQALGQCEDFLRTLKNVNIVSFYDTAGSARMVRETGRRDFGAIASAEAAKRHRLSIVRRSIESNHPNFTRFVILGRTPARPNRSGKTSLVFATRNVPGVLFQALAGFAVNEINLLKIESRPMLGKPWEYLFYLDIDGTPQTRAFRQALNHLKDLSTLLRLLGSYPKGKIYKDV